MYSTEDSSRAYCATAGNSAASVRSRSCGTAEVFARLFTPLTQQQGAEVVGGAGELPSGAGSFSGPSSEGASRLERGAEGRLGVGGVPDGILEHRQVVPVARQPGAVLGSIAELLHEPLLDLERGAIRRSVLGSAGAAPCQQRIPTGSGCRPGPAGPPRSHPAAWRAPRATGSPAGARLPLAGSGWHP